MFSLDRLARLAGVDNLGRTHRSVPRGRRSHQPRLQRVETLERREMMSVTGGWLAGGFPSPSDLQGSPAAELGQDAGTEWGLAVINKDQGPGDIVNTPGPGIYYDDGTQTVSIYGTNRADQVEVSQTYGPAGSSSPSVLWTVVTLTSQVKTGTGPDLVYTRSETFKGGVSQLKFWGYDGGDLFLNHTSIGAVAFGGPGDDVLVGGSGHALLYGQEGNDKLSAGDGGTAHMEGGPGDDVLNGGAGIDFLYGGADNDTLRGGGGYDTLEGGTGDDVLVSIGYGDAVLFGGPDDDSFWQDPTDVVADVSAWELTNRHLHEIDHFEDYRLFAGQTIISVDKELDGPNLVDPLPHVELGVPLSLRNFHENPLFASFGPAPDDVYQGGIGDCYFMAPLSAIAQANPDFIRQMVVDLGDGTYAVRFYKDGGARYVRVDADLWCSDQTNVPRYAGLGLEDSLWVAIVEKAWAFFRTQEGGYSGIDAGGSPHEAFGTTMTQWTIHDVATPQEVAVWFDNNKPDGAISDGIDAYVADLFHWLEEQWAAGKSVVVSSAAQVWDGWDFVDDPNDPNPPSGYRASSHVYMVDRLLTDPSGTPNGVRLRNPYGSHSGYGGYAVGSQGYFEMTNASHLYFCFTGWRASDVSLTTAMTDLTGTGFDTGNATSSPVDAHAKRPITEVHPLLGQARRAVFEELGADLALKKQVSTRRVSDRVMDTAFAKFGRGLSSEVTPSEDDRGRLFKAVAPAGAGLGIEWGVFSPSK